MCIKRIKDICNDCAGSFTIEAVLISNIMLFFIVAVVNTMLTVYDNNIVDMVISDTIVFIESNDYNEDNKDIIDDYIKQKLERKIIFLELRKINVRYNNNEVVIEISLKNNSSLFKIANKWLRINSLYDKTNSIILSDD